jgi:3-oxoacyl-[acyl-carrier protein] reductase
MMSLNGKVALVTGASRGIGRAIAIEMAREGAEVVVNYNESEEKAREVAHTIEAMNRRALIVKANVSKPNDVEEMRKAVDRQFGTIQILVNNAGIHYHLKSWEMDWNEWSRVIDVNLGSAFLCSRAFSSEMRAGKWGRIINVSSIDGFTGTDHEAHYAASKAGIVGLTKSLALELAPYGITVNAIAPGWIETDMTSGTIGEKRTKALELIPLRKFGQPEDIAHAAVFLASDHASFITGQTIHVNGGEAMF